VTKRNRSISKLILGLSAALFLTCGQAGATLVDLGPGSFTPVAPMITFDEVAYGTVNPVINFTALPGLGDVTVSFASHFVGQVRSGSGVVTLNPHDPTGPLTLDSTGTVDIRNDGANPTSPVLSGSPTFNGPISILFSTPVAGVGLTGGYFDAINGTTIEAYDAAGSILGSITNSQTGLEFYGLADSTGANVISGISFFITGSEPYGFAIDNVTFGAAGDIPDITVPEPLTVGAFLLGVTSLGGYLRRRRAA